MVMAGSALYLLYHEQQRLRDRSLDAVEARAELIVENLDLAMDELKTSLMDSLAALPEAGLPEALSEWQRSSALVCAAASCSATGELLRASSNDTPAFDLSLLQEAQGYAWQSGAAAMGPPPDEGGGSTFQNSKMMRKDLKAKAVWGPEMNQGTPLQKAWVYDAEGERFRMAAWLRPTSQASVRALEVSIESLLGDLRRSFPDELTGTEGFALQDPFGKVVHEVAPAAKIALQLPVGEELPGWQVLAYHHWGENWGAQVFWLGTFLVLLLTTAILLGGRYVWQHAAQETALAEQRTAFVSNVSHELKTPLTSIRMYAELMRDGSPPPRKQHRYLDVMVNESQRLTRLVNNVLDFSRLEQDQRAFTIQSVSLREVVETALNAEQVALQKAGMEVDVDSLSVGVMVRADPDALERILLNVIDNAVKYAAPGAYFGVQARIEDRRVVLSMSDRGPGIPHEDEERIFKRFHRLDDGLTSATGTGLGLSIARMLAEGMDGALRCRQQASGEGAVFELTLMRAE